MDVLHIAGPSCDPTHKMVDLTAELLLSGLRVQGEIRVYGRTEGHRHTGVWVAEAGINVLIAYGPCSGAMAEAAKAQGVTTVHCQNEQEVLQCLRQFVQPGDALLAKASHAMKLEELLQDYYAGLPQA